MRLLDRPFRHGLLSDFFRGDRLGADYFDREIFRTPPVNIREEEERFVVEVAAPGMAREDFQIRVDHGMMTISSNREDDRDLDRNGYSLREYSRRSFTRTFSLPDFVNEEDIEAKYEDGMLFVLLPKTAKIEHEETRSIPIG